MTQPLKKFGVVPKPQFSSNSVNIFGLDNVEGIQICVPHIFL